jgi:hypothetical protein
MISSPGGEPNQIGEPSKAPNKGDIPPEYLGSVLRAEIMPADEESPDRPGLRAVLQRINLRYVAVVAIAFILIGSGLVCMIGPGKPILENSLTSLKDRYAEPTLTNTPRVIPAIIETPQVLPTSTIFLISTATRISPSTTPTIMPTEIATEDDGCVDPLEINLDDVGETMCVRGIINGLEEREVGFIVYFSDDRGIFYLLSYDLVWDRAELGDCIQVTGEIQQLGNTPVIVFSWNNLPEFCP